MTKFLPFISHLEKILSIFFLENSREISLVTWFINDFDFLSSPGESFYRVSPYLPFSQSSRKEERIAIKNIACHVIHQRVLKLSSLNEAITPGSRGRGDNEIFSSYNWKNNEGRGFRVAHRGSYFFVSSFLSFFFFFFSFSNVDKERRVERNARLEKEEESRLINSRCPLPVTVTRVSLVS